MTHGGEGVCGVVVVGRDVCGSGCSLGGSVSIVDLLIYTVLIFVSTKDMHLYEFV